MELTPLLILVPFLISFTSFYVAIIFIKKMFSQQSNCPTLLLCGKCISTVYKGSPMLKKMDLAIYQ
jgi:hypothetical protein